jgi:hypothetical protein
MGYFHEVAWGVRPTETVKRKASYYSLKKDVIIEGRQWWKSM